MKNLTVILFVLNNTIQGRLYLLQQVVHPSVHKKINMKRRVVTMWAKLSSLIIMFIKKVLYSHASHSGVTLSDFDNRLLAVGVVDFLFTVAIMVAVAALFPVWRAGGAGPARARRPTPHYCPPRRRCLRP